MSTQPLTVITTLGATLRERIILLLTPQLLLSCAWLLLSGCASGGYSFQPAALTAFEAEVKAHQQWRLKFSSGTDIKYPKLYPALDRGQLFVAEENGQLHAVDASNGGKLWELSSAFEFSAGPGVSDELLVIGSANGEVVVVDRAQGAIRWQAKVTGEVLSTPVISTAAVPLVVVRTLDGKLFGLNVSTGARIWTHTRTIPRATLRGASSPVIVGDAVIAGFDDGKIAAIDLHNGTLLWEEAVAAPTGNSEFDRLVDIDADLVYADGVVYTVAYQGQLMALDAATGTILWKRKLSSYAGMTLGGGALYVTDDQSRIWALDSASGATLWRQDKLIRRKLSRPVLSGSGDWLAVADYEGYVHWMSSEDGRFIARRDAGAAVTLPLNAAGATFYVYHRNGALNAIEVGL